MLKKSLCTILFCCAGCNSVQRKDLVAAEEVLQFQLQHNPEIGTCRILKTDLSDTLEIEILDATGKVVALNLRTTKFLSSLPKSRNAKLENGDFEIEYLDVQTEKPYQAHERTVCVSGSFWQTWHYTRRELYWKVRYSPARKQITDAYIVDDFDREYLCRANSSNLLGIKEKMNLTKCSPSSTQQADLPQKLWHAKP